MTERINLPTGTMTP